MTSKEKDEYFEHELDCRVFKQEGNDHHVFNVQFVSYRERFKLEMMDLPLSVVNNLMGIGAGINANMRGYNHKRRLY